jgi:5'(3')-deoxyribonucleotidase
MRIGIDIDDVACDMKPSAVEYFNRAHGADICVGDITGWNPEFSTPDDGTIRWSDHVVSCLYDDKFVLGLPAMDGAKEGIRGLAEFHDVILITSRRTSVAGTTYDWVRANLGEYPIIFARHDKNHGLDMLIDDAPHHINSFRGDIAFIFDQPWNRVEFTRPVVRVKTWSGIVKKVCVDLYVGLGEFEEAEA